MQPTHFASFIEHVLAPTAGGELLACSAIPDPWRPAWSSLARAADMDDEELFEFARHLRIELGQTIPDGQPVDPPLDPTLASDLEATANLIDRSVRQQRVTLSRRHLLDSLGWLGRTQLPSHHDFPLDPLTYRRNKRSSAALTGPGRPRRRATADRRRQRAPAAAQPPHRGRGAQARLSPAGHRRAR
jgi:hypothetical protein